MRPLPPPVPVPPSGHDRRPRTDHARRVTAAYCAREHADTARGRSARRSPRRDRIAGDQRRDPRTGQRSDRSACAAGCRRTGVPAEPDRARAEDEPVDVDRRRDPGPHQSAVPAHRARHRGRADGRGVHATPGQHRQRRGARGGAGHRAASSPGRRPAVRHRSTAASDDHETRRRERAAGARQPAARQRRTAHSHQRRRRGGGARAGAPGGPRPHPDRLRRRAAVDLHRDRPARARSGPACPGTGSTPRQWSTPCGGRSRRASGRSPN